MGHSTPAGTLAKTSRRVLPISSPWVCSTWHFINSKSQGLGNKNQFKRVIPQTGGGAGHVLVNLNLWENVWASTRKQCGIKRLRGICKQPSQKPRECLGDGARRPIISYLGLRQEND